MSGFEDEEGIGIGDGSERGIGRKEEYSRGGVCLSADLSFTCVLDVDAFRGFDAFAFL